MPAEPSEREEWYRRDCDQIAWRNRWAIRAEADAAYLETSDGERVLCRPTTASRYWYETWLALKHSD